MVRSNQDIMHFVGTPTFLRFAFQVAMATMHFYIVEIRVTLRDIFCIEGGPKEQFSTRKKLS